MKPLILNNTLEINQLREAGYLAVELPMDPLPPDYLPGAELMRRDDDPASPFIYRGDATATELLFEPPYIKGDILYIRESWQISSSDEGTHSFIFEADESSEGKGHKWNPADKMPNHAVRVFARVLDVIPLYTELKTAWTITIEQIGREDLGDEALPFSEDVNFEPNTDTAVYKFGTCKYCGQRVDIVTPRDTETEADELAAEYCQCTDAQRERRYFALIDDAKCQIEQLFGSGAESQGFNQITADGAVEGLGVMVELIARRKIVGASIQLRDTCKARLSTTKGKIRIERIETYASHLEAGE